MALVTRMTRPTRPAAAAVSTVCAPRTLKARRVRASESGVRSKSACTTTSTPFRRPARAGDIAPPPRHAPDVAPLAIDRDDLLDVPRRGEPGGYGGSDAARRPGYRHHGHRLMMRGAALGANRPPGVCHSVLLPR